MEIKEMKQVLKEKKITYDKLAEMTGYSKSCITKIFGGFAKYPRLETIKAIERALESVENPLFDNGKINRLTDNEKKLLNTFSNLNVDAQDFIIDMTEKFSKLYKKKDNM